MALEIEREFLVTDDSWRAGATRSCPFLEGSVITARRISIRVCLIGIRRGGAP
jgi:CYTH domain-containing protein